MAILAENERTAPPAAAAELKPVSLHTTRGWVLAVLYPAVVAAPLLIAAWITPSTVHNSYYELGRSAALLGITILAMQALLAARFRWIEQPFGLDMLLRFHRSMGILALALVVTHPVLLAAGGRGASLIFGIDQPWFVWLGRLTLLTLFVHVAVSVFRKLAGLTFEKWRRIHDVLGMAVLAFAFIHSLNAGEDLQNQVMQLLWIVMPAMALTAFIFHRIVRPRKLARTPYEVVEVKQETSDVHTIRLAPPHGAPWPEFLPGQFHFLTLQRRDNLPVEEHHFTISSSPGEPGVLESTIKASGDFTETIGDTRAGDTALVQGPFGRFCYLLHPQENELVFVAGGIGITPVMSMLRYLRDTQTDRRVLLLYGNKTEQDIVFREELAAMERDEQQWLRVVHVLSNSDDDWQGERGHIDREKIERYCGEKLDGKAFYLCGPEPMTQQVEQVLRAMDVPRSCIHGEAFSFVDGRPPAGAREFRRKAATISITAALLAAAAGAAWLRGTGF